MSPFDPDRFKQGADAGQPPPPNVYEVSVQDAGAFVAESSGKELGKSELRVLSGPEEGRTWVVWMNLDSDIGQDMAAKQCAAMGLDTSSIQSIDDVDQLLRQTIGEYYEVKVVQKGQYLNTWFQGPITATTPASDIPNDGTFPPVPSPEEAAQKIEEAKQESVGASADDDDSKPIPF